MRGRTLGRGVVFGLILVCLGMGAAAAEPAVPTKEGRIFFWKQGRLASVRHDGKDLQWHSKENPGREDYFSDWRLSPDGTQVAYGVQASQGVPVLVPDAPARRQGDNLKKIYVRGLSVKDSRKDLGIEGQFWCWSVDSTQLIIASVEESQQDGQLPDIPHRLVDVRTGKQSKLTIPAGHLITDWSPDSEWFLTTKFEIGKVPKVQQFLVTKDGPDERALTDPNEFALLGKISPDGQKIMFISFEKPNPNKPASETQHIRVVNITGGKSRRVTKELNADSMSFCWAPDSKRFAYIWRQVHVQPKNFRPEDFLDKETESHLMVADVDGDNPVTLLSEKRKGMFITLSGLAWR